MRPDSESRFRQLLLPSFALLVALALAALAGAIPVSVTSSNLPTCDPLSVPDSVDELGNPPAFPADEKIGSFAFPAGVVACPSTDTAAQNHVVQMTNMTGTDFREVWYVADPETSLSNVDGFVNGEQAFRIDGVGANAPLMVETIAYDGVFQAGEIWEFIIDDYFNTLGLGPHALASAGLVGSLSAGDVASSGSIVAIPEPEHPVPSLSPIGTALLGGLLFAIALGGLAVQRRRRAL